ncbi:SulP family inorganic anion transporter [Aliamphritea spongicola]|uniref:SulP family inorganic anion transporter n=1 Tax=Aliamphritea spongicola TaxID=707589 RepID=UPI00196AAFCD|nr:SulP family inorganic anion transporter [Aliamphritea spongicola]MBN3563143.1 SulP family inorganic anion transporter [Aliamphritea spongicola]
MKNSLFPFLVWLKCLTFQDVKADFIAGITGAIIVLPQGVAFATIAGLPPEYGLYTAMVTPIIAALFGSSKHLISGPTTAISIVVFSAVSGHAEPGSAEFVSMALTLTLLAGIYQLAFGLARLGKLVDFVSHTVVIGFTAGAAILIATSQVKHITGIPAEKGLSFTESWMVTLSNLDQLNWAIFCVGMMTLLMAVGIKRYLPKIPNLLVAMVFGSLIALAFGEGSGILLVGAIPTSLPPLSMPDLSLDTIRLLAPEAFAIALLGLIEAVSISRAIAIKSQQRIYPNQEFLGQGLSNIVGSFFSCYAGSGSFTRSGVNYSAGAKSPLSAIFAAVLLMLIVLLVAPLTAYLPVAAMGGVIMMVAYNLVDFHHIKKIMVASRPEASVLIITFVSTLFLELEFAIYLGVLLSLVLFLAKTSTPEITEMSLNTEQRRFVDARNGKGEQCPQLKVLRVEMSIYFGSVNHIQNRIEQIAAQEGVERILIICLGINFIDMSGVDLLVSLDGKLKAKGGGLYFFGMKPGVMENAAKLGLVDDIGEDRFFANKSSAISSIFPELNQSTCENCDKHVFRECEKFSQPLIARA